MRLLLLICVLQSFISTTVRADELSGTWKFNKSAEYFGNIKEIKAPPVTTFQVVNGQLSLQGDCSLYLKSKRNEFFYSDVFQGLSKQGVDDEMLGKYFKKTFTFDLKKVKYFYEVERDKRFKCGIFFQDILISENTLIVPAGEVFYGFTKSNGGASAPLPPSINLYDRKLSQLPFNTSTYSQLCLQILPFKKRVPQTTTKCAPVYYPYVASKQDNDALAKLIGTHDYEKGGARNVSSYDNPFKYNLHPVFVLLPPLKDVLIAAVIDLEPGPNENRDTMSGAFLAIKEGKVTDQLNDGCTITEDYFCVDDNGKRRYQLLDSGKFKEVK
ncbi:MAG: hypothetical protein H7Z73_04585 [Candidatus Saccharibacteria bacterium]|nr:hypothetical protein [Moraxellaceae bacterium]